MFTGYSALMMAEALPDDGCLITCEIDPKAEAIARRYFGESLTDTKLPSEWDCVGHNQDAERTAGSHIYRRG